MLNALFRPLFEPLMWQGVLARAQVDAPANALYLNGNPVVLGGYFIVIGE